MKVITSPKSFPLEPEDNSRLASLCGEHGDNLKLIEERLKVVISNRGNLFYETARFIKDIAPCVEFGLVGNTMHKINECVSVNDLKKLIER